MKTIEQAIRELEADNVSGLSYLGSSSVGESSSNDEKQPSAEDGFRFNDTRPETISTAASSLTSEGDDNPPTDFVAAMADAAAEKRHAQAATEQIPASQSPVNKPLAQPSLHERAAQVAPDQASEQVSESVQLELAAAKPQTASAMQRPVFPTVTQLKPRTPKAVSSRLTTNKTMRRPANRSKTENGSIDRSPTDRGPTERVLKSVSAPAQNEMGPKLHIPLNALKEKGMISPDEPSSIIAQQFRAIKRPLVRNLANAPLGVNTSVILVTSSQSGEGKSFTAVNLAMSLAMEREKNVLLIDTDSTKAAASSLLGVEDPHVGLMDSLVRDDLSVHQVLRTTDIPNLSLLPVGRAHGHATELLASDRMRRAITDLSEGYPDRIMVIDSSPLLQTEEAGVLADIAGQIVFVVAAEQTAYATALDAVARLPRTDNVSLVLNKARKASSTPYGYGGYGYGAAVSPDGLRT